MSRVSVEFGGESRGAVTAAKETAAAIRNVREVAAKTARENIVDRVQERQTLEKLAAEYTRVAQNAKRGSEVQVAALKLEQRALRELSDTHGVYSKRLQSSTREAERFSKGIVLGSGALGHMGRTAALASLPFLGGVGVIQVLKDATHEGASLETQLQRTDKVFGASAGMIKTWSESSVKQLALARSETLDYAASIGTLLQNMGLTPAASAAMSKTLLQRAADVAAFKGVATGDVIGAFNAGLQGRTRALKQYGIVLDATAVKQEAERLGLVKNTVDLGKVHDATVQVQIAEYNLGKQIEKHGAQSAEAAKATIQVDNAQRALAKTQKGHAEALTADQRAQATYNAILEQTGKQQGWLAGHVNTLAVQERILHAEEKQLFEILGTGLIPMLVKYLPHLTAWIDKNEKNGTFAREFNSALKTGGEVINGVIPVVKEIAKAWGLFSDAVGGSDHAIEILLGYFAGKKLVGGLTGIGTAAGEKGAAGAVGLLSSRLTGLGAISIAPIVIPIALAISAKEKSFIEKHFGKAGAAIFDSIGIVAGGGVIGGLPALVNDLSGGGGGGKKAGTASGIVSTGKALGPGSGAIYERGGAGGTSGGHTVFDCSGYVYDVFTSNGFNGFPRTSEAQYNTWKGPNWTSEPIALAAVEPGDVVFFNEGHDPPPGHVALIVSGSGLGASYIEYYQTGKPARTSTGFAGRNVSAAKRFYLVKNSSGHTNDPTSDAGGGNRTSTIKSTTDTTGGGKGGAGDTTFIEKGKVKKPKILTGTALLDQGLQFALATAHGTPGTTDDLKYLKEARAELEKLQKTASKAEQVPIAKELANVNRQITAIDTANLKSKLREIAKAHREAVAAAKAAFQAEKAAWQQHVQDLQAAADAAKQVFESHWQTAADRTLSAFDDITSRQLTSMGKATSAQLSKMQRDAAAAIQALKVTVSGAGFASFLFGGPGAQTPTEMLLAKRAAAKQTADDITSIADATKKLADAQAALAAGPTGGSAGVAGHDAVTLASGDTVTGIGTAGSASDLASLQQAVVDAQKALDAAIYQQETDDLTAKAQLERDAADKALSDAQNAFQDQADAQQQAYQDQQDAAQQAYQDQRAIERQNITDWLAFQEAGLEAGTIQWTNFYAQLVALAAANGLTVGAAFWGAWQDANNANAPSQNAAATAKLVASYKPVTAGSWSGLVDPNGVPVAAGFQGFDKNGKWTGIGGFASGGWADKRRPVVDPRDTIPAMLRRGEFVSTPEDIAAHRAPWGTDGGQTVGDVYLDGEKVGIHVARHVTNAQERQIDYKSPRG